MYGAGLLILNLENFGLGAVAAADMPIAR